MFMVGSQIVVVSTSLKAFVYAGSVYLHNINLQSESGKSGINRLFFHCLLETLRLVLFE